MDMKIIYSKSVSDLIEGSCLGKSKYPLIAIIDTANIAFEKEML
jgi:hypothetical protein